MIQKTKADTLRNALRRNALRETQDPKRTLGILVDLYECSNYLRAKLKKFTAEKDHSCYPTITDIVENYSLDSNTIQMVNDGPVVLVKGNDSWVISYEPQYSSFSTMDIYPYTMGPYIHIDRGNLLEEIVGGKRK